jgi:hypothetical protein
MTTLTDGITTLDLGQDLRWLDEFSWVAVQQEVERSITGKNVLQVGQRVAGRPITLASDGAMGGLITGAQVVQCQAWAGTLGQELTLSHNGQTHDVVWRLHENAIDADPLVPYSDPLPTDLYRVTLRLMTV